MNDSEKKTTLKTPGQASQGFWYESLSPTQILTGEQNLNSNQKQRKKKKCRDNRKAQHLRRRERRRQEIMKNNDTNHMDQDKSLLQMTITTIQQKTNKNKLK